jgi:hypothetical protein
VTKEPADLFSRALKASGRRLALKIRKRHATLDMRDLDASWPTYLEAQAITLQQEYEATLREAIIYFIEVLMGAGHAIPGEPLPNAFDHAHITALLRLTGPIHIKRMIRNGYSEQAALLSSLRRSVYWTTGDMYREANQQVIDLGEWANERSETVVMQGYERVPEPTACAFCRILAGASRKHAVFNVTEKWREPHPGCKCEIKPLPVYRTKRILTAREIALNKAMYESIKASRDRALAKAKAA